MHSEGMCLILIFIEWYWFFILSLFLCYKPSSLFLGILCHFLVMPFINRIWIDI